MLSWHSWEGVRDAVSLVSDLHKHTYFLDDEGSLHALCSACGQKYLLPTAPLLPPFQLGIPHAHSEPLPTADMDAPLPANVEPVPITNLRGRMFWMAAATTVVAVVLGLSIWGSMRAARTARQRDRAMAAQILAQADALLAEGKPDEAQLKYDQLSDYVAYRRLHDASLAPLAVAARTGQQKIEACDECMPSRRKQTPLRWRLRRRRVRRRARFFPLRCPKSRSRARHQRSDCGN